MQDFRLERGLTVTQAATVLGCTPDTVRRWEKPASDPRARQVPAGALAYLREYFAAGCPEIPTGELGAAELRATRKARGMTLADCTELFQVPRRTRSHWAQGTRSIPTWAQRFFKLAMK